MPLVLACAAIVAVGMVWRIRMELRLARRTNEAMTEFDSALTELEATSSDIVRRMAQDGQRDGLHDVHGTEMCPRKPQEPAESDF